MSSAAQSLSVLMLIAAVGIAGITTFALRHYREPGARGFSLTGVSMACWTAVVAINVYPTQILPVHVSMTLRNAFLLGIALGWLLFVLEYTRRERIDLRPLPVAAVLVIPVVTVVLTATNPLHHLVVGAETPSEIRGGAEVVLGPWQLVFLTYVATLTLIPAWLLARDLRSAHGEHRRQIQLILAGWAIAALGANDYLLISTLDGVPRFVRISAFTYLTAAGLFTVALFRYQLFGLVPVSRRTVVETMPDPVIAVDSDGTVRDVNPAARELFGWDGDSADAASDGGLTASSALDVPSMRDYSVEDIAGTPLEVFCRDHPEIVDHYRSGAGDTELSIDDGETTRYFSVTSERINEDQPGSVILLRDVTALKRREQQLERKNQQLDEFASFVTHDLRNPLTVANLSLEAADSIDDDSIEKVKDAHQRMEQMIADVREIARIDRASLDPDRVDLAAVASRAWDQVETGDARLSLPENARVKADEQYLLHVFENLFRNSIEHGGTDAAITVGVLAGGFYVEDDGPGIPESERADVLDYGYSTAEGGGFGLAIVKNVAEVHGWEVTVTESEEGGARFEFTAVET
jgi:nitrogen-specific signal transduction histidine kinase